MGRLRRKVLCMQAFRIMVLAAAGLAASVTNFPASAQPVHIIGELPDEQPDEPFGPADQTIFSGATRELMKATAEAFWAALDATPDAENLALPTEIIAPTDLPAGYTLFGQEIRIFEYLYAARIARLPPGDDRPIRTIIDQDPVARALLREYMTTYTLRTDPAVHGADVHAAHAEMVANALAHGGLWAINGNTFAMGSGLVSENLMESAARWTRPKVFRVPEATANVDQPWNENRVRCVRGVYRVNGPVWEIAPVDGSPVPKFEAPSTVIRFYGWVTNYDRLCSEPPQFQTDAVLVGETADGSPWSGGWQITLELLPSEPAIGPADPQPICGAPAGGIWKKHWAAKVVMTRGVDRSFDVKPEGIGAGVGWVKRRTTSEFRSRCSMEAGCACRP